VIGQPVTPSPPKGAEPDPQGYGDDGGEYRELERGADPIQEGFGHRLSRNRRPSHVPGQNTSGPGQVLDGQRVVQPVALLDLSHLRRGHLVLEIDGDGIPAYARKGEHDDRGPDHDEREDHEPSEDVFPYLHEFPVKKIQERAG
jgi:hypothetical protein